MARSKVPSTPELQRFAKSLEHLIDRHLEAGPKDRYERQKAQVEKLFEIEDSIRKMISTEVDPELRSYRRFVEMIRHERRNILLARPFFRVRKDDFNAYVSPALKANDYQALAQFPINHPFIKKAVEFLRSQNMSTPALETLYKEFLALRNQICEENMPLAMSRAKLFLSRTPRSHLSHFDMIQIASEGLLTGIDKYCGEFSKVWRGVAVGRITGLLIYGYSQTMLYFFPKDRRKLYRANKDIARAIRNKESVDYNELARSVSEHVATTPSELHELVAGASMLSCDSVAESADGENEGVSVYSKVSAPTSCQPDVQVEKKELHSKLQAGIATLSLRLRKVLKMRGI